VSHPTPERSATTRKASVLTAAFAALLLVALCAPLAVGAKDETILVSRQSDADGGAGADGEDGSFPDSVSADGRFVAFESDADNLSSADDNGVVDVYVRDLQTNTTTLVSRQSAVEGGAVGNAFSSGGSISADGRFVAFTSRATNLTEDAGTGLDVFVRDLQTNTTTLVSRQSASDGGAVGDDGSFVARISADGRVVTFTSRADNLSDDDDDEVEDIFVRNLAAETTTLVSRAAGAGGAGGDADSARPAVSADGRHVAFDSEADNLSGADNNGFINVFVRDLETDALTLVSRQDAGDGGAGGDDSSFGASISDDGSRVEFASRADNLSADDNNEFESIYVRDLDANTTTLVTRQNGAGGGGADDTSNRGEISANGRFVGFSTPARNLSDDDDDAFADVFVRDLQADTTTLVSRQSAADGGAAGDGDSDGATLSADGRFFAFDSEADNLSDADNNAVANVFLRDVRGEDGGGGGGALTLELSAKKRQRAGKPVKVKATCSEDCTVKAKGRAKREGRKKLKLKRAEAELTADRTQKLRLKPSKKVARKLRRAGKAKARITATATDAAGNEATESVKVKLR
jgi:Tol biopolymer transport system component